MLLQDRLLAQALGQGSRHIEREHELGVTGGAGLWGPRGHRHWIHGRRAGLRWRTS